MATEVDQVADQFIRNELVTKEIAAELLNDISSPFEIRLSKKNRVKLVHLLDNATVIIYYCHQSQNINVSLRVDLFGDIVLYHFEFNFENTIRAGQFSA